VTVYCYAVAVTYSSALIRFVNTSKQHAETITRLNNTISQEFNFVLI